jgi:uncharacterized DUF497 family protein
LKWRGDVFNDPFAVEWLDDREDYGEDRYVIIGLVKNRLLFVAYTIEGRGHSHHIGARSRTA